MRKIYIVVSKTPGKIGYIVRRATRYNYNHISVGFDNSLSKMHTFARLRKSNFIIGGYREETVASLALGTDKDVQINLYEIPLSDWEYGEISRYIDDIKNDNEKYYYNLLININIYKTMTCLSFALNCLKYINNLRTDGDIISISNLEKVLGNYKIFNGSIRDYPYLENGNLNMYYYKKYTFFREVYEAVKYCLFIIKRHTKLKRNMI